MNIDLMRAVVVEGQIATITAQIKVWEIYEARTGESVATIVAQLQAHITALQALL